MSEQSKLTYAIYPDLAGKTVLVTGGGSGIGAEMVAAFARQGARVFFVDIAEQASQELARSLADAVHPPVFLPCDLTDLDALAAVFARIGQGGAAVDIGHDIVLQIRAFRVTKAARGWTGITTGKERYW